MTPLVSTTLLRTQSDVRLVALAAQGHERAFEAIVERYRRPLHRFCRRVLPEARAEDAVQHTFLKAWTALGAGTQVEDLKAWLYRIARNAALDSAKKAGYDYDELTESLRMAPGVDEDLERRAIIRETLTGVATLPDNQREALLRTAVDGHSRAEIARDMDVTEGAVRQLVHRARTTLRAAATALTPLPLASWAAAFDGTPAAEAPQRIAEVAAGAGSAGGAGILLKAGTAVIAAGVLAAGPPGTALRHAVEPDSGTPDAQAAPDHRSGGQNGSDHGHGLGPGDAQGRGRDNSHGKGRGRGPAGGHGPADGSRRGAQAGQDRSGIAGSGEGHSGSASSGLGSSGGDDHRGSSGSGTSGSGTSGSGSSGSGTSGSGDGHSGSGTSGSGVSGTSGSGTSGDVSSTSSGDGSSGSGSSGSSGPGSGETTTTTTTTTSHSGPDGGGELTSGSTSTDGPH